MKYDINHTGHIPTLKSSTAQCSSSGHDADADADADTESTHEASHNGIIESKNVKNEFESETKTRSILPDEEANINISKKKIKENLTIFPYYFLNPIPNTYTTDLTDGKSMLDLKLKYVVRNNMEVKFVKSSDEGNKNSEKGKEDENNKCDYIAHSTNTTICTYAIHWWQRSWQQKKEE